MSKAGAALIWCPFPSQEEAQRVAGQLVEEKLVACANILPGALSVFAWEGEIQTETEVVAVLKTTAELLPQAVRRLEQLHSYDVPAIAGWEVDHMPEATLAWLKQVTQ